MAGKRRAFVWGCAAALMCAGIAVAEDCSVCTECSADPAFVQRDMRNPQMLLILKRFAWPKLQQERVSAVVVLSDAPAGRLDEQAHTVVLLGDQGGSESVEVKGDLPAELTALVH